MSRQKIPASAHSHIVTNRYHNITLFDAFGHKSPSQVVDKSPSISSARVSVRQVAMAHRMQIFKAGVEAMIIPPDALSSLTTPISCKPLRIAKDLYEALEVKRPDRIKLWAERGLLKSLKEEIEKGTFDNPVSEDAKNAFKPFN